MHTCVLPPTCCCYNKYILQNKPTQSRKNKILSQNFTILVLHVNLQWGYFKINNYNWQRTTESELELVNSIFYPYNDVVFFN
jgi:hypothetical protein